MEKDLKQLKVSLLNVCIVCYSERVVLFIMAFSCRPKKMLSKSRWKFTEREKIKRR